MESVKMAARELPVLGKYDVIVLGGGTAGSAAAISAAREGLKTLVIEQFGALGGTQTMAMVTPVMRAGIGGECVNCSIDKEIFGRMQALGASELIWDSEWFDPTMLKFVLEEMAAEAGCDILYHTTFVSAALTGQSVDCVVARNKDGLQAYRAKRYIDCSGDADLAVACGVAYESGNRQGYNQNVSLRFEADHVDLSAYAAFLKEIGVKAGNTYPAIHVCKGDCGERFDNLLAQGVEEGLLTPQDLSHFQMFSIPGRLSGISFNCPELGKQVNVIDAGYLSAKQLEGKRAAIRILSFMKKYIPGFADAYITNFAPMVGVRESRRIKAVYTLTAEDIFAYRKFDDGFVKSNYPLDVHGGSPEDFEGTYARVAEDQRYWEIPYRSLVPAKADNLLVAGRCAGFSFRAQAAARVQHTCRAMGEAAGIAAGVSIEGGTSFQTLDGKQVRVKMRERGANV